MKKQFSIILLLPVFCCAQGIHFEERSNWQQVLQKAKTENKYIFLDCYATWCVPCKYMDKNIYPLPEVGQQVNEHFISVKVQMDTSESDNEPIKAWYRDAHELMRDYMVSSFPTFLFFSPNGNIVHRAGGSSDAKTFIAKVNDVLDSSKQYYTLLHQYQNGERDSMLLSRLTICAIQTNDELGKKEFGYAYMQSMKNIYDKDNLACIAQLTRTSKDAGFAIWLYHKQEVDAAMGKDYAERKVMNIIMEESNYVKAANKKAVEGLEVKGTIGNQVIYGAPLKDIKEPISPDWKKMCLEIKKSYGNYYSDRITTWIKMSYYKQRQQWENYDKAVINYLGHYKETIRLSQLNSYAWDMFTHSTGRRELETALQWSRETLDDKDKDMHAYYDTYANLLYKLKRKDEAVKAEEKAVELAPANYKKGYEETLKKIKTDAF
ncbi:MAG: thioredoxin fold domain-containing protein [Bacteroidota bacterium]